MLYYLFKSKVRKNFLRKVRKEQVIKNIKCFHSNHLRVLSVNLCV